MTFKIILYLMKKYIFIMLVSIDSCIKFARKNLARIPEWESQNHISLFWDVDKKKFELISSILLGYPKYCSLPEFITCVLPAMREYITNRLLSTKKCLLAIYFRVFHETAKLNSSKNTYQTIKCELSFLPGNSWKWDLVALFGLVSQYHRKLEFLFIF